jgi:hypothetical protein
MPRKTSLILAFSMILTSVCAAAQSSSGILPTSRAANWANAGVPGVGPGQTPDVVNNWPECTTSAANTLYAAGTSATSAQIDNALSSCSSAYPGTYPNGSYVLLAAGTYSSIAAGITFSNLTHVVLRGAGANQTILVPTTAGGNCNGPYGFICMVGGNSAPSSAQNSAGWSAGYSQGTTSITLSSVRNLAVGSLIALDQCDTGFSATTNDGSSCNVGSNTDNGAYFNCMTVGVCTSQGGGGPQRINRSQEQEVYVTSIAGSGPYTVGISPGLYNLNWNSTSNPGATWPSTVSSYIGIENMSWDTGALSAAGGASGVIMMNCYACWATGNRSVYTGRNHYWLYGVKNSTVANNYMYGTQNCTDVSYGIETYLGGDTLIINNVGDQVVSPTVEDGADTGDVIAYNYVPSDFYCTSAAWLQPAFYEHNAGGGPYALFEGNQGTGFEADNRHGNHNVTTLFRNYLIGNQASCAGVACTSQTLAINANEFVRYFNYIGNVLGESGYHNTYSQHPTSSTEANGDVTVCGTSSEGPANSPIIYGIGWSGSPCFYAAGDGLNDPYSRTSAMFWGNYDVVTGAVRWCGNSSDPDWSTTCGSTSEIPTGLTDGYAVTVPSSTTLPNSFFLTATTTSNCGTGLSWWKTTWGCAPFPPIGPDVTSGNIPNVGGFANNLPAELVWANTPIDTSYQHSITITNATWSSGTATLTGNFSSVLNSTCSCIQGEIRVSGINPSGYNGTFQITGSNSNTVTVAIASSPGTFSSSGTALWPNIRLWNAANYLNDPSGDPAPAPPTGLSAVVN